MALTIKIDNFEGPFDLLLHLIHKNKMDIYNIRISEITQEYIEHLREMKNLDVELTSEFILMASTLLEVKSNMLLPKKEKLEEIDGEETKEKLTEKLIYYKKFKIVAEFLKERYENTDDIYLKKPDIIEKPDDDIDVEKTLRNLDLNRLNKIFCLLIENYGTRKNPEDRVVKRNINLDKYKVEKKVIFILKTIGKNKTLKFSKLIENCREKIEIIVTFLALLELIRLKQAIVYQENIFSDFIIERI